MGFQISHKVKENQLKPGDHIYAWRPGFLYAHHGIFLRTDKVIHLQPAAKPARCGRPKCGFRAANGSAVLRSCLRCFLGERGVPRLYRYGVPAVDHMILRGGTCSTAKREPDPSVVIHRAKYLLKNGFGGYNLVMNNCEDFALYCSTGLVVLPAASAAGRMRSGQVGSFFSWAFTLPTGSLVAASPFIFELIVLAETGTFLLPPIWPIPVAMGIFWITVARPIAKHNTDIGVRKDVVKVTAEHLAAKTSGSNLTWNPLKT